MAEEEKPRRWQRRAGITPPKEITLPAIFMAVHDFRDEIVEMLEDQHEEIADGISLLFQRTDFHAKLLAKLRGRTHAERNAIQILALRQDQLEQRLDEIDHKGFEKIYDQLVEELGKPFKDTESLVAMPKSPEEDDDE